MKHHSDFSFQSPASSQEPNATLEESEDGMQGNESGPAAELRKQPQSDASDDDATDCSSQGDERDGESHLSQHSASDYDEAVQVKPLTQSPLQYRNFGHANDK